MNTVEFLFDFGSPNGYLSHRIIPAIEKRTGAKFTYTPVLLGGVFKATNNRSPMEAFAGIKNKLAYEALETRRFVAKHGLTKYTRNPHFPVNTLLLMRTATAAWKDGGQEALLPFVEAAYRCMWEDGKKMDDPAIAHAALSASGVNADALLKRAQDQDVKDALLANTNAAVERGVFGIPTFFVGDEIFFGKDRLRDVEEELVR